LWARNAIPRYRDSVNYWYATFEDSITTHFNKIEKTPPLDYVVIDYKYFSEISQAIGQSPNYLKNRIDQYISQNHNDMINKLIKLNY
jgi:hypothetical protein